MKRIYNLQFTIYNSRKGFTLIELLIVVAIIGVLATLLMANFVGVRQRARDGQRKADLRQIQSALELYRSDQEGDYPLTASFPSCGSSFTGGVSPNIVTYMQKVPCDPSTNVSYQYNSSSGSSYCLRACLENVNDPQADPNLTPAPTFNPDCTSLSTCGSPDVNYTLQNP